MFKQSEKIVLHIEKIIIDFNVSLIVCLHNCSSSMLPWYTKRKQRHQLNYKLLQKS